MSSDLAPISGDLVHVRSRRYLVDGVVPGPVAGDDTLVSMSCVDDDAREDRLEVLWEREIDARIITDAGWQRLGERGFDSPGLFAAYLNTLRWNTVTATDPTLFQAPFRAGIEVMAYQLEPLRKALRLPRVNLFIADDVGLGKTIEAALIVRELMLRQRVQRVVVAAPPSVVPQWREELEQRFGLTFVVYDREYVRTKRIERGHGVNPWTTHTRFVISHALLRDESYVAGLRDWLGESAPGSLLILDEAHHAAPASGTKYAIDSQFTRTIRDLAARFEHRLFLSATPHNGHSNSFAALLELLDPQRFTRGVAVKSAKELDAVMVRRLKEDLRRLQGGFPERHVEAVTIDGLPPSAPELKLAALIDDLDTVRRERLASATKSTQAAGRLPIISLQKRLFSSLEAFARTARVHEASLLRLLAEERADQPALVDTSILDLRNVTPLSSDDDAADDPEEEHEKAEEAAVSRAVAASGGGAVGLLEREIAILAEMRMAAEEGRYRADARIKELVDWTRKHQCPDLASLDDADRTGPPAQWLPRRVIIFTEYADTKRYLEQQLRAAIANSDREDDRIAVYHGGMGEDARERVKASFNADPDRDPLRILIATDAAREGLNLQQHCSDLFHFDLPWNPARLEQRNGRIDRKGQRAPEVFCRYFVYQQRPEDRVLDTLVRKTERIGKELGSLAPVLQREVEALLARGFSRTELDTLQEKIENADIDASKRATALEQLEATRSRKEDLELQLDQLQSLRGKAEEHLNFRQPAFRAALDRALELAGAGPLEERMDHGRVAWSVPLPADDPAWSDTLDTLRPPRDPRMSPAEWRARTSLRPIVFSDDGRLDGDAVQLHLEHRVVQRLLGRFTSQGLVHFDLARACVGQVEDSQPRVVLLGRLSVYGPRAGRLHEELIAVTARWKPVAGRAGPLEPFAEKGTGEMKTLDLLDRTLPDADARPIPEAVAARLLEGIPQDIGDLRPHLETRADAIIAQASALLKARGIAEADELTRLIRERRDRIIAAQGASPQLELSFSAEERKQLQSERRHWSQRLEVLEAELRSEPARVREGYEVRSTRVEPLGIVYLWPMSG